MLQNYHEPLTWQPLARIVQAGGPFEFAVARFEFAMDVRCLYIYLLTSRQSIVHKRLQNLHRHLN